MRKSLATLWVPALLLVGRAGAQEPYLVKDLVPGAQSSFPSDLTDVDGKLFFLAYDSTGAGLWTSDGSSAGTVLVKRFFSVSQASTAITSVGGNGHFFFVANDGFSGDELWVSDGTDAGTMLVKDIVSGAGGSFPSRFVMVGDTLFFETAFSDDGHQEELWRTDGTEAGTSLVKADVFEGSGVAFAGALIFSDLNGNLWRSDGTPGGTVLLKAMSWIGTCGSDAPWWTISQGRLYFVADDGVHGAEIWRTDGTAKGTTLVRDLTPGSASTCPYYLTDASGKLFFTTVRGGLFKSDGTSKGTRLVRRSLYVSGLVNLDGRVLFGSWEPSGEQRLWRSDGTTAGTVEIRRFPGDVGNMTAVRVSGKSLVYLSADDGATGQELWRSNGTIAALVHDITPPGAPGGPSWITRSANRLFFIDNDGATGWELWALPLFRFVPPLRPLPNER